MSYQFNNSELLVELSTEAQQLIAGGQLPGRSWMIGFPPVPPIPPLGFGTSFTRFSGIQSGIGLGRFGGFGGTFGTQYRVTRGGFLF